MYSTYSALMYRGGWGEMDHPFCFRLFYFPYQQIKIFQNDFLICVRTKHYLKNQPLFKSLLCLVEPQFSHKDDQQGWGEMAHPQKIINLDRLIIKLLSLIRHFVDSNKIIKAELVHKNGQHRLLGGI